MPSLDEVTALNLSPGVPVLRHWRTAYAVDRPIRVTRTIFAADRNRLVYEGADTSASNGVVPAGRDHDTLDPRHVGFGYTHISHSVIDLSRRAYPFDLG